MRTLFGKSVFSVVVLVATLFSVVRLNVALAGVNNTKITHYHFVSQPKSQKNVQSYISELKEYSIENGEELDDENDDNEEIIGCFFRSCVAIALGSLSDNTTSGKTLGSDNQSGRGKPVPLFIEFENFRL